MSGVKSREVKALTLSMAYVELRNIVRKKNMVATKILGYIIRGPDHKGMKTYQFRYTERLRIRGLGSKYHTRRVNAVKEELLRIQTHVSSGGKTYSMSILEFPTFIMNLWKAIGQKDPRVECDTCPDICVAYTSTDGLCPDQEDVE